MNLNFLYELLPGINWGNLHFVSTADMVVRGIVLPALAIIVTIVLVTTVKETKKIIKEEK